MNCFQKYIMTWKTGPARISDKKDPSLFAHHVEDTAAAAHIQFPSGPPDRRTAPPHHLGSGVPVRLALVKET